MRGMELRDRICVVTGGASGIGRAMCQRFAAEGARAVVVVDRDADGALAVAGSIGDRATARTADVTVEADIEALVEHTEDEIGPIDLFASNAGILGYGGIEASDDTWSLVWSVNVLAHLYAARAVVPRMIERGGGYLLSTASAAGLLTQPGDAPSEVGTAAGAAAVQGVLSPEHVAETVVEGIRGEKFLILPHPDVATFEQRRAADRDRWLAGMRRLSDTLAAGAAPTVTDG